MHDYYYGGAYNYDDYAYSDSRATNQTHYNGYAYGVTHRAGDYSYNYTGPKRPGTRCGLNVPVCVLVPTECRPAICLAHTLRIGPSRSHAVRCRPLSYCAWTLIQERYDSSYRLDQM